MDIQAIKPKKKRRRLRVSCVECTRRRQKCDRQQPCGLCKQRKVEHLCRWELEPFARPPPARPPPLANAPTTTNISITGPNGSRLHHRAEASTDDLAVEVIGDGPHMLSAVDAEVKEAAIALAQLSVARQGEYLGTGSMVCELHRLNDSEEESIQIEYERAGLPFVAGQEYVSLISSSFSSSLQTLVNSLPPKLRCDVLITSFFEHENWNYSLPRSIIMSMYNRMWEVIQADVIGASRIKIHWLTLLYALFCHSPACESEEESRKYFLQSLTGRRLVEDLFCASFATSRTPLPVTEGQTHGCLAAVLLATYMRDRGQVTEAWKMVGCTIRTAVSAGLHRNPSWSKWKGMTDEDRAMRRITWLLLLQEDKFLSFILGRPLMIADHDTDVPLPNLPEDRSTPEGVQDMNSVFQAYLAHLLQVVGRAKEKYLLLEVNPQAASGSAGVDAEFEAWESSLPRYLAVRNPSTAYDPAYPNLPLQRASLAVHYFCCRMIFRRTFQRLYSHLPTTAQLPESSVGCTKFAIDSLRAQRQLHQAFKANPRRQPSFSITFLVFEAAVTISIALLRNSSHPRADEWREEVRSALALLNSIRPRDAGDLVQQAALVLNVLQDASPARFDNLFKPTPAAAWSPAIESAIPMQVMHDPVFMQAVQAPLEWVNGSMRGAVATAYELLHGFD